MLKNEKYLFYLELNQNQNFGGFGGLPSQLHPGVWFFDFFSFTCLHFLTLASIGATAPHKRATERIHVILFFTLSSPFILYKYHNTYFLTKFYIINSLVTTISKQETKQYDIKIFIHNKSPYLNLPNIPRM